MRAGTLRHKVEFKKPTSVKDNLGAVENGLVDFINVFASIEPIKTNERIASNTRDVVITHKIRVRYIQGVTSDMKIFYKGREFKIISIINSYEQNKQLEILANEVSI